MVRAGKTSFGGVVLAVFDPPMSADPFLIAR
jgi:hypothetical protein